MYQSPESKQNNLLYLSRIYRIIVGLLFVGFLSLVWPYISNVVLILVFAFLFTTVLLKSVDSIERRINNRGLSVLIVTVGLLAGIGLFIGSFISEISQQATDFSNRIDQDTLTAEFSKLGAKISATLPEGMATGSGDFSAALSGFIQIVIENLAALAGVIGNFVLNAAMILIFTIILLAEYHHFKKVLVGFFSNKYFEVGLGLIYNIEKSVSSYLRGQFLAAASVAVMSLVGLTILNFTGANLTLTVFIGIIAGLANLIPLVGPFVGMIPAILIAFMNNIGNDVAMAHQLFGVVPSPFYVLDIVVMFIIVQQIEGNLITPTLVGKSVGIHPMMVMISLIIGGTLMGPLGMLFAVPATGILKVIIHEIMFVRRNAHLL
ncbi:MAG: AI-2E family transporter [Candidatus Marinimicrobia bacterium]|jgi:predicted PurR-regulated permease PerM|nr:AI-2E family transporter [Candidatus Neomarinimicrobiota bacterium]MBT3998195.1 AI-2E family transporter [Candidatus Neomarinimicrobiota bacterium]MBT4570413.1 AI-2E family transporter [Candidatus Neomarinimicrobiota bacterium]MBT4794914.1 AI-2E family transporter [Candidatus Neomarinimicrobiota bacterium]MBT6000581.1 AI-2E family transporter [Candidatus Neomarinimicrobiota bacterium]